MLLRAIIFLLLMPSLALCAIASVGDTTANTCSDTTSGNTLVCTTNAAVEVGNVHIVFIAANNNGTTDADHSEISSVADSAGNTYLKLCEFTNGQGVAAAGATISLWLSKITSELASGGTFTINFANTIASRVANGWEFTVGAGVTLEQSSTCQVEVQDAAQAGSLAFSGLSSLERLYVRAIAQETNSGAGLTETTNYTDIGNVVADGGTVASSMGLRGEFRIVTATGETSDPANSTVDQASVFVALYEVSTRRAVPPVVF